MKFKNALKFLLASALLTSGAKIANAVPKSSDISVYKQSSSITDYADYYFNAGGVNMWIGSQRGVNPYVSLNQDDLFGSFAFNYHALDFRTDQKEVQALLNLGKKFESIGVQALGGLDIKRSNYEINTNTDRNFVLSNGSATESEIAKSNIEQTANFFSAGASKKIGKETNVFLNFGQYFQVSDIKDRINNIYNSSTFDRDSINQEGIPIVTETNVNINNYTLLNSGVYNKRKVSILETGFEKDWGKLGSGFLSSKISSKIFLDKSKAEQTLSGSTRTNVHGNTLVIVNNDSTNIGFNSSTINPLYAKTDVESKNNEFGIRANLSYDLPYSGEVRLTTSHTTPNQNELGIDFTYPLAKLEKYNNQGAIFNGSLNFSPSSTAFNLGIVAPIGFDNVVNSNILLENLRDQNYRSKKYYENKRNLEESVVYSEDTKKLLSAGLEGDYFSQMGNYSPSLILGAGVDFKKPDVHGYGGYSDNNFSVVGKIGKNYTGVSGTLKKHSGSPTLGIGYDNDKKAVTFEGSLNF